MAGIRALILGGLGRRFGCLWASYGLANLADGILLVGLPLIAVQLTRSPTLVAGVTVALTLPWLLFGIFTGALADRLDRRTLMICSSIPRVVALTLVGFAAWGGMLSLPLLYAAAFVAGTAEGLFDIPGQALVPTLVPRDRLRAANGRLFGTRVVANDFLGAPLAGVLVGYAVASALLAPAALYLLAPLVLLLFKGRYAPARDGRSTIRGDIREGLRELWRNPTVRTLAIFGGVINLALEAFFSLFALYAVGVGSALRLPEAVYGVLMLGSAGGAVAGSLVAERLGRGFRIRSLLTVSAVMLGVGIALPAVFPNTIAAVGGLVLVGVSGAVASVLIPSLRQELVPERLLGRVGASSRLITWGTRPVGPLLGGAVATALGLRPLFLLCAGTLLLAALIALTISPESGDGMETHRPAVP